MDTDIERLLAEHSARIQKELEDDILRMICGGEYGVMLATTQTTYGRPKIENYHVINFDGMCA